MQLFSKKHKAWATDLLLCLILILICECALCQVMMNVFHLLNGYKPWHHEIVQHTPHVWKCSSFLGAYIYCTRPWTPFEHEVSSLWQPECHCWCFVTLLPSHRLIHAWNVNTAWSLHITSVYSILLILPTHLAYCCHKTWTCQSQRALNRWATNWSNIYLTPHLFYYEIYSCQRGKGICCSLLKVQCCHTDACRSPTIMNLGDSSLWVAGLIDSDVPSPVVSFIMHPLIPICALHQGWGKDKGDRL